MNGKCWLIGNPDGRWPSLLEQAAFARGLRWSRSGASSSALSNLPADREIVFAIAADQLAALAPPDKQRIAERVTEGAVLYVKGGFKPAECYSMAPFANSRFSITETNRALGWRVTDHQCLPRVLAQEAAIAEFESMTAAGTTESVEPILFVQPPDGRERPAIFTIGCGAGSVIYDLTTEEIRSSASLLGRLEEPATFADAIGAVVAPGFATPVAPPKPSFNLVIDDRPANLDYLSTARLRAFMRHLNDRFFGIHVDFAWTPDQSRPSRRYIEILKEYQCGFVWHGLLHHVDHRTIADPDSALGLGRHLVETICQRYQVRLQPVMVFPFERDTPATVELLRRAGFLAMAETPPLDPDDGNAATSGATVDGAADRGDDNFMVLKRYPVGALTRSRMLALATLGLPIIAAAHPRDVSLRRLPLPRRGDGSFSHFDQVLGFAAEKQLQPASLERIALEALTTRSLET